jgi:uncharacterized protein involved in outer membrane biogenesis
MAVLVAAIGVAAWQLPAWLDWGRYRSTVEVLASATLGVPVTIDGKLSLTLLPEPELIAERVSVGDDTAGALSVQVKALRLKVALWPLLAGRVDARDLTLNGPTLRVPFPAAPDMHLARPPTWLAAFAAHIENGSLVIGDLAFTDINGSLTSLEAGSLAATGTVHLPGTPPEQTWRVAAKLTAAGSDGVSGLDIAFDGDGKLSGASTSFSGQLAADGSLTGDLTLRAADLSLVLPAPAIPLRADGRLSLAAGSLIIDQLQLDLGGSPARCDLALRFNPHPALDIAVTATRLDLNAWLPTLQHAADQAHLPIDLDLSADAATLAGGMLQHLHLAADLAPRQVTIRDASAVLPGDATLRLSGVLAGTDLLRTRFEGDAKLTAPALRTTLRWLDAAGLRLFADLPPAVLQRADIATHVVAAPDEIGFSGLSGKIDDSMVVGSLAVKPGVPPAITADLTADRLDLGNWFATGVPKLADVPRLLAGNDVALRLQANMATLGGQELQAVTLDAATAAGHLALRRLETSVLGVKLLASGTIGDGGRITDGRLQATTRDASPLAPLVPAAWRATPALWHSPASLQAEFSGAPTALTLHGNLALGGAQLEAWPVIDLTIGSWAGQVTVRHPGARRLLVTLGLPERIGISSLEDWPGEGSLSLAAQLGYAGGRLTADSFTITAGTLRASGRLALDTRSNQPRLTGRMAADTLPLPLPALHSETQLPLAALIGWQATVQLTADQVLAGLLPIAEHASCTLELSDGKLTLDQVDARFAGGAVSGTVTADATASPPVIELHGALHGAVITSGLTGLPFDLQSGRSDMDLALSGTGYSAATLLATLTGELHATVTDGTMTGFDLFRIKQEVSEGGRGADLSDALASGSSSFDRLDIAARLAHGSMTLAGMKLSSSAGDADFSGAIGLADGTLDVRIAVHPAMRDAPEIAERLTGPLTNPRRTPELAGLARWLAERGQQAQAPGDRPHRSP